MPYDLNKIPKQVVVPFEAEDEVSAPFDPRPEGERDGYGDHQIEELPRNDDYFREPPASSRR